MYSVDFEAKLEFYGFLKVKLCTASPRWQNWNGAWDTVERHCAA